MMRWNLVLAFAAMAAASAWLAVGVGGDDDGRARRLHFSSLVLDTHIDTPLKMMRDPNYDFGRENDSGHVDLPRLKRGGLDGAFFSIYMPGTVTGPKAVSDSLKTIASVHRLVELYGDDLEFCTSASDVRRAQRRGKFAMLMGMEGGHMIHNSLPILRMYARLGIRYLTLTHNVNTDWADSVADSRVYGGLNELGRDVVKELNRLGVLVDVSHVSDETFWDILEVTEAPVMASHSSCRDLSNHPRNMSDEMIRALAEQGGVIQITFVDQFLDVEHHAAREASIQESSTGGEADAGGQPIPPVNWERIIDHIDHAVQVAGVDHVGLGSDFDGADMPRGMEDVSLLPKITQELLKRGYDEDQIRLILGENTLRILQEAEAAAIRIRAREGTR